MGLYLVFVFALFQTMLALHAGLQHQKTNAMDNRNRGEAAKIVATAVQRYYDTKGSYPADLNTLASTPGYEHIRSSILPWSGYALATGLNDGVWTYSRAVVYTQDNGQMIDSATYLNAANNTCGTGAFATAADWCGPQNNGTHYWREEQRQTITRATVHERQRLKRLLDKFAHYYSAQGLVGTQNMFPNPGSASKTLATIVGYGGTATTCSGIYYWSGIPLDCTDLYSTWGTPTTYNYVSATHIVLLTKSTYVRYDGAPFYVSTELAL